MNIVFDIDGTLSIVGERLNCLNRTPRGYDEFYARCGEDRPNKPVIWMYRALLTAGHTLVIYTDRRDSVKDETSDWLDWNGIKGYKYLLMRKTGDIRADTEVKPELLAECQIKPDLVLEDKPSMVDYWRAGGVTCFQVSEWEDNWTT